MKRNSAIALLSLLICLAACHPKPSVQSPDTVKTDNTEIEAVSVLEPLPVPTAAEVQQRLVTQYQRGEIEQCLYKGAIVYRCSRNAPDAGSEIYDAKGDRIGRCYYSTNSVDPVCKEATDCKVIYRMAKNIWGNPEVVWVKPG